jgi:hypothetical protein
MVVGLEQWELLGAASQRTHGHGGQMLRSINRSNALQFQGYRTLGAILGVSSSEGVRGGGVYCKQLASQSRNFPSGEPWHFRAHGPSRTRSRPATLRGKLTSTARHTTFTGNCARIVALVSAPDTPVHHYQRQLCAMPPGELRPPTRLAHS